MAQILVHFGHQVYMSFQTVYTFFNTTFEETLENWGISIPEFTSPVLIPLEFFLDTKPIYWFLSLLPYVLFYLFVKFLTR